ncbi:MAG TPA: VUT family protein [Kofleriaceae bacterium]
MSFNSTDDRWLLPRHQTEYPARALLPEAKLHGRREATFLVLAALYFIATTALLVLGMSRVIDVSALLTRVMPGLELPSALLLPLGVMPFALSFIASALVCELFGRRRASALNWMGLLASAGLIGLMRLADLIDGGDAFGIALAFAACCIVAHACNLVVFDAFRKRAYGRQLFTRMGASALLANAIGWSVFALVLRFGAGYIVEPIAWDTILALSIGAATFTAVAMLVLAIPAVLIARGLTIALRVGQDWYGDDDDDYDDAYDHESDGAPAYSAPAYREPAYAEHNPSAPRWTHTPPTLAVGSVARRLPQAQIVDDDDDDAVPQHVADGKRRARSISVPPYTSAEMRFFSEGDESLPPLPARD